MYFFFLVMYFLCRMLNYGFENMKVYGDTGWKMSCVDEIKHWWNESLMSIKKDKDDVSLCKQVLFFYLEWWNAERKASSYLIALVHFVFILNEMNALFFSWKWGDSVQIEFLHWTVKSEMNVSQVETVLDEKEKAHLN